MTAHQRDALISFCFNVGAGAPESSTLRKRLLAGESPAAVIAEELPRWCKGPNGPLEGLKRRRAAEVANAAIEVQSLHMAATGASQARPKQEASEPIQLLEAVRHHRNLPHQRQAWQVLQRSLTAEQLNAFATAFRASSKAATPIRPPAAAPANTGLLQLPVPYLSQNDSATSQGSRCALPPAAPWRRHSSSRVALMAPLSTTITT